MDVYGQRKLRLECTLAGENYDKKKALLDCFT